MHGLAVHDLLRHHTIVFYASKNERYISRTFRNGPCACLAASDFSIFRQCYLYWRHLLVVGIVHAVFVYQQLVGSCQLGGGEWLCGGNVGIGHHLAIISERRGNEPSVAVRKQLVCPYLMSGCAVVEFRMAYEECPSVVGRYR